MLIARPAQYLQQGERTMIRNVVMSAGALLFLAAAAPAFGQEKPAVIPHDLEGKDNCAMCHSGAMEGMPAMPESHEGRGNETCVMCHAEDAEIQTADAPAIPHDLEGKDMCTMCHSGAMEGMPAVPESHAERESDICQWCHTPAE